LIDDSATLVVADGDVEEVATTTGINGVEDSKGIDALTL
jgi:hypothetical protein